VAHSEHALARFAHHRERFRQQLIKRFAVGMALLEFGSLGLERIVGKLRDFGLEDPALHAVAEVVHDVDLKEAKYDREETRGIDHLVVGLAWAEAGDEERLTRGAAIFDALYSWFGRRKTRRDG
jgi:hypothetical protein